jgi:hypothetical protein
MTMKRVQALSAPVIAAPPEGLGGAMRDHAHTLSDFLVPTISIECAPCGRFGRYHIAKLMEQHGDAKLPKLLQELAQPVRQWPRSRRCETTPRYT